MIERAAVETDLGIKVHAHRSRPLDFKRHCPRNKHLAGAQRSPDARHNRRHSRELRNDGEPTPEAEAALRTYASALIRLVTHEEKLKLEAQAKKGETKR
jgi:hypothetical protein